MTDDTSNSPSSSRQRQFDEILAALLRAIDAGQSVDRDVWLAQHPDFAAELKEYFAKHERLERLVRPLRQAAANVLHVRCPHCHNPIELLDQAPLSDISCPSCGSSFSLVSDNTLSHDPRTKSFGHFELLDRVGMGQFGSVWKARDTKLDRTVAIKIPRNARMDSAQTEMFLRDARAAAQLKHPNIVGVHEVGKQDDMVYIVSDFIQGATLKEWTAAKRLTPREAAELCVKIAKALHHAHEAGVIHRDLKPSNIMMDADGEPHIVDFGLAKREAGEITMTVKGQILGTPAYMSPEQARGEGHTVDRRADIYSLGVIAFELLTGELPFRGDKQMLLVQILKDDPPSPRSLNSDVPRDLDTICLKCLEKEPGLRYLSAILLADDLHRFLVDEPILARPTGLLARGWRWSKRRPAAAGVIGMTPVVVGLLMTVLLGGYYNDRLAAALGEAERARIEADKARIRAVDGESAAKQEGRAADQARAAEQQQRQETERALNLSDDMFYFLRITAAERAWQMNDVARAEGLLNECPKDSRNWEWFDLKRLCDSDLMTVNPQRAVTSFDVSPDGRYIALVFNETGSRTIILSPDVSRRPANDWVYVVDREASDHRVQWKLKIDEAICVAFTRDGSQLLVGKLDGTLDLFEQATGKRIKTLTSKHLSKNFQPSQGRPLAYRCKIKEIVVGPRSERCAITHSTTMKLAGGGVSTEWVSQPVLLSMSEDKSDLQLPTMTSCVAFSADGKYLATGSGYRTRGTYPRVIPGSIELWDAATMERVVGFDGVHGAVGTVAFSPDNRHLVSGHSDGTVRIWTVPDGNAVAVGRGHIGAVSDVLVTPDGKNLVSGGADTTLRVWDMSTGQENRVFRGHKAGIRRLALTTEGNVLLSSSDDNTVKVWNVNDEQTSTTMKLNETSRTPYLGVAFDPEGQRLAIVSNRALVRFVDVDKAQQVDQLRSKGKSFAFDVNGQTLVTGGKADAVTVWDVKTRTQIVSLNVAQRRDGCRVAMSSDGRFIATGTVDGVMVWDAMSGESVRTLNVEDDLLIRDVVFSPNTMLIAYAVTTRSRQFGEIRVCDFESGATLQTLKSGNLCIWDIEFSPDGSSIASASGRSTGHSPGELLVWNVVTGQIAHRLKGHRFGVWCITFHPDGSRLASGAGVWGRGRPSKGGEIKIWDLEHGQELLTMRDHSAAVMSVAFSDDGKLLASAGSDGTVRLWKTEVSTPWVLESP